MLAQRVATAIVLIAILAAALLFLQGAALFAFFGLIAGLAGLEWTRMCGATESGARLRWLLLLVVLIAGSWFVEVELGLGSLVLGIGCAWWLFSLLLLSGYPASLAQDRFGRRARSAAGLAMIVPVPLALMTLIERAPALWGLALLFGVVWLADIGAYFTGRAWGRTKLAPSVSPGKTREGALGGAVVAFAVCLPLGVWQLQPSAAGIVFLAALILAAIASAIVGDLVESAFKRSAGVKDSGTLLPGHGGVLDRVDSMLAAAPVFALGLLAIT